MDELEKVILRDLIQKYSVKSLLDIGANVGEYSLFAKLINKDIDCLMIEANTQCQPYLEATGIPYTISCLSNEEKTVSLYLDSKNEISTGVSYFKENTHHFSESEFTEVKTETLENLLKKLNLTKKSFDIIKIDTQGSEKDVILGGIDVIKNSMFVQLEVSLSNYNEGAPLKDEIVNLMNSLEFSILTKINDLLYNGIVIQENVMFFNRRKFAS
jgi:FkbM family methyltransferase